MRTIEAEHDNGFRYQKVIKDTGHMTERIRQDPEGYEKAKENAKKSNAWKPVVKWYEGRERTVSDHEKDAKKAIERFRGHNMGVKYEQIAELCGCSVGTISLIMCNENRCSEEMADRIITALSKYEGKSIKNINGEI